MHQAFSERGGLIAVLCRSGKLLVFRMEIKESTAGPALETEMLAKLRLRDYVKAAEAKGETNRCGAAAIPLMAATLHNARGLPGRDELRKLLLAQGGIARIRSHGRAVVPMLLDMLRDGIEDVDERTRFAKAIGECQAGPIADDDEMYNLTLIEVIENIGGATAAKVLFDVSSDTNASAETRRAARWALARLVHYGMDERGGFICLPVSTK